MIPRQRVPVIYTISMLDMLCCALGAVLFLMILHTWDARRQAKALALERGKVGETARQLAQSREELGQFRSRYDTTAEALRDKDAQLAQAREQMQTRDKDLEATRARLQKAQTDMAAGQEAAAGRERKLQADLRDLEGRHAEAAALAAQVPGLKKALAAAETHLRDKEAEAKAAAQDLAKLRAAAAEQEKLLAGARDQAAMLEKQRKAAAETAALVPDLQTQLAAARRHEKALDEDLALLRRQAEAAGLKLADAQKQVQTVQVEAATLRKLLEGAKAGAAQKQRQAAQGEGRFAGVDLSGRRVVLLVDMSGSMGSVDANTLDPNKWPGVRKTVVQVLRSLPDVEKFQVILFSTDIQYLLGRPGEWLTYDRDISPEAVNQALSRVFPRGDTNLHAAFDAAFKFRAQGLDSIFLFSDGLPNIGPGLPANPPPDPGAQMALLGTHLRDTIRTRWNAGLPKVRVHAIGFFYESPNLGAFLWALTRENGGSFVGMSQP